MDCYKELPNLKINYTTTTIYINSYDNSSSKHDYGYGNEIPISENFMYELHDLPIMNPFVFKFTDSGFGPHLDGDFAFWKGKDWNLPSASINIPIKNVEDAEVIWCAFSKEQFNIGTTARFDTRGSINKFSEHPEVILDNYIMKKDMPILFNNRYIHYVQKGNGVKLSNGKISTSKERQVLSIRFKPEIGWDHAMQLTEKWQQ
jgi:hypothetical protein|tara:strand:- start:362 stop:970 length:609 start_codon:yes stop_codon:yes gene_type:complete